MKKIYEYVSFDMAVLFTVPGIMCLIDVFREKMVFDIVVLIVCCVAVVSWIVFATIYWKVRRIKKNPIYINTELVPQSVRVIPFFREFIIKVVVAYFDPHTGKTTLYKGSTTGHWRQYQTLKNGEKILVRVVYDAKNPNNYQVLLREALIKIW